MAMCPSDRFTDVGHDGGPQPSLMVAPWETTVVFATMVSTIIVFLVTTTAVAAVVVPAITVAGAAAVVLARRVRRCQKRRQWRGHRFVGVERRRSSSWTRGV
jgi:hypothetical protein